MVKISLQKIKQLRLQTKAGVMDCRQALEATDGALSKAAEWLRQKGMTAAGKRVGRRASAGLIETYIHHQGQVAGVVELNCETDFVARTDEFKKLAHELAMQVAAMDAPSPVAFLKQPYIRDPQKTIAELIKEAIAKIGENIVVGQVARFAVGQKRPK